MIQKKLIDRTHTFYYQITGAKWFNRASIPFGKLEEGDMFNVYRREYTVDKNGNIKDWICDIKHGCFYDGISVESSLEALDKELDAEYTSSRWINCYGLAKPLTGNEPCV